MSKPDSLHVGLCLALLAFGVPTKTSATEESALDWRVDARLRYEVVDPTGFGRGPQDDDGFALWRIAPSVKFRLDERWSFTAQVFAAGQAGRNGGPRPADRNDLDLTQAFIEWRPHAGRATFARFGRQEIALGSGRLLAASDGANVRRRFDGALASWQRENWTWIGVVAAPVQVLPGQFDDRGKRRRGVLGVGFIHTRGTGTEGVYLVRTRREDALYGAPAATQTRDTLGARIVRRPGEWLLEAEALVQSGDLGELEIRAWAVAGEVRATLTTLGSARLRAGFTASAASGDSNPGDRRLGGFDPLFPNPAYTGSFPLFGPTNIVAIDPGIALEWPDGKRLAVDVARMRRIEVRDSVYNLNGGPIPGLSDGRDIGALWALSGSIRLTPQWTFNATAAHLEAGDYFGPSGRDIGAAFVNLNFTF